MIESGLALCATCLPVHYGLTKSQGVQSMVRSLQSAISLHSRSSPKGSAQRSKHSPQGSQEHIVTQVGAENNDGHALEMGGISPMDGIVVTQSLEQVGDQRQENNEEIRTGPYRV